MSVPAPFTAPDAAPARLALALGVSVLFHGAVLYGVAVVPPAASQAPRATVIEARLVGPARPVVEEPPPAPEAPPPVQATPVPTPTPAQPAARPTEPTRPEPAPAPEAPRSGPQVELPLAEDPTWYPAAQVDVHPKALQPVLPEYPELAAQRNIQGEVTLLLLIDEGGVVREASVVNAKPEGYFEESALAAFRAARFAPAQRKGRVVKARALIRVSFELTNR